MESKTLQEHLIALLESGGHVRALEFPPCLTHNKDGQTQKDLQSLGGPAPPQTCLATCGQGAL